MIHRSLRYFVLIVLVLPNVNWAGTIYVNNVTGDDRSSGLVPDIRVSGEGPLATIGRAFQIAVGTDTISIANTGVPYEESVTLDRPNLAGLAAYPLIIEGNGAVMRGLKRLPSDVWRRVGEGTYRYQPYRKAHYQLMVNGTPAQEVPADSTADAPPALEPLQWCAFHGFVYFRVEPKRYIDQYEFEAPLYEVGLGLHHARNVIVRNLNVEGFRLDGIAVTGNSRNVRLVNVRSTLNGRAGLSVSGTSRVEVGGLDLAGNRVAERLMLVKGQITDLPEAQVPPKPTAKSWNLGTDRYVQILPPRSEQPTTATAARDSENPRK